MGISRNETRGKRRRRSRVVKSIVLSFLLLMLLGSGYGAYAFTNVYHAATESYKPIDRTSSPYREEAATIGKNPISILLMGVEDYETDGKDGRTDTLILATLNPGTKKMTLLSIPRDTRVPIAGRNGVLDKINSAYAYGGEKATIETVENFLHIPIDYYVKVGFTGFVDGVDEIGGVDVNVPFDFWEHNIEDHNKRIDFTKGPMHLNGQQALAYVRMRKRDPRGDFGRNDRQRQVIESALNQVKSVKTLFKVDNLSNIIGKNVETNLKPSEIFGLEKQYANAQSTSKSFTLDVTPGHGSNEYINNIYYYEPDPSYVQQITDELRKQLDIGPDTDSTSSSNATVNSDEQP